MPNNEPAVPFGHEMLKKHFLIEDKYVNLNHGQWWSLSLPRTSFLD